ncbi:MAG TPA: hypothetical protein DDW28_02325 [Prevotella sp.]|nr:hypothetical protein [Candidatus Segatella violae]
MFEEICSIYESAKDAQGRFVDRETGECIQQMSIREFCLTDRWKPHVERLRAMRQEYGDKAKRMPEYIETKKMLPGATLSGLFSLYEDVSLTHPGQMVMVSRRETHLKQHTGWLAIDIDLQDNEQLSNFENIKMVARFRPEIGLLMRSCSGTGYFGLVRLAYPDKHKEQFKALLRDYAALGIVLDKQCGNIGRVRFASWDDAAHIYINENVQPYRGMLMDEPQVVPQAQRGYSGSYPQRYPQSGQSGMSEIPNNHSSDYNQEASKAFWNDPRTQDRLIELMVKALVGRGINITESYDEWTKCGWALKAHPYGEQLFHDLSACSKKYNSAQTSQKWRQLGSSNTVTYNYLIHAFRQNLGDAEYHAIKQQVWRERG